jgi:hypothetical protein
VSATGERWLLLRDIIRGVVWLMLLYTAVVAEAVFCVFTELCVDEILSLRGFVFGSFGFGACFCSG